MQNTHDYKDKYQYRMEEISMYRVNVNERGEQEEERDLDVNE